MKVFLVTESYPPKAGGSGWSTHQLAKALVGMGHSVHVLHLGYRSGSYELEGVPVIEMARVRQGVVGIRLLIQEVVEPVRLARATVQHQKSFGADVVHAQHRISTLALSRLHGSGPRLISTVRDYWPICDTGQLFADGAPCSGCQGMRTGRCLAQRHPAIRHAYPLFPAISWARRRRCLALGRADAVIAVSQYMAEQVGRCAHPARTRTIPNMVEISPVGDVDSRRPQALFVGKLEANKGAHLLPQISKLLPAGVELLVAGDGKLSRMIKAQSGTNLKLLGWATGQHVRELMRQSSVLVFPSLWPEPLSRVLLEATAAGLPAVAFPVGGNPEIVHNDVNGYLVHTTEEMAHIASEIALNPQLRLRLEEGAVQIARSKFAVEVVMPKIVATYSSGTIEGAK